MYFKNAGGYIKAAETIELFKLKMVLNKMPQLQNRAAGASYYFLPNLIIPRK